MKIAIDSGPLKSGHAVRGIGFMVKELIAALENLTDKEFRLDAFDFQSEPGRKKLESKKYDIVHYTYFFPYSTTLPDKKYAKKVIVTIQDLIQLIYPQNYKAGVKGKLNFIKQKFRLKMVDAVITISETSKKDIVRFLGIPPEKVYVVYLAPRGIFKKIRVSKKKVEEIREKYKLPKTFVLYVGDVNYNKNIPGLVRACKASKIPLVITGKHALEIEELGLDLKHLKGPRDWFRFIFNIPHPELAHFSDLIDEFRKNPNIVRTGFVPDEDLVLLYNLASVYVQPSFYEGFGLPIIEAFRSQTPVIIAKTNALVEIAGGAALIADPENFKDLAEKINYIVKNPKVAEKFVKKGLKRVKDFSWEKTAKDIKKVYLSVLGED